MKVIRIDHCDECPYTAIRWSGGAEGTYVQECTVTDLIVHPETIPAWCPLKDDEVKDA